MYIIPDAEKKIPSRPYLLPTLIFPVLGGIGAFNTAKQFALYTIVKRWYLANGILDRLSEIEKKL